MAKKKTQIKKPSIAAILGMILLGLVLVGVVANVIKDNVKEKDPIVEELPGEDGMEEQPNEEINMITIVISNPSGGPEWDPFQRTYTIEDGMTWGDFIDIYGDELGLTYAPHDYDGDILFYDRPQNYNYADLLVERTYTLDY